MPMGPGMVPAQMAGMAAAADGSGMVMPQGMPPMMAGHPPGPPMLPGVSGAMMMPTPPRDGPGGPHVGQMGPGMAHMAMIPPGVAAGGVPPHPPPHPMGPGHAHRVGGPVPVHAGPPPAGEGRSGGGGEEGGYGRGPPGQHGREHGAGHRGVYR